MKRAWAAFTAEIDDDERPNTITGRIYIYTRRLSPIPVECSRDTKSWPRPINNGSDPTLVVGRTDDDEGPFPFFLCLGIGGAQKNTLYVAYVLSQYGSNVVELGSTIISETIRSFFFSFFLSAPNGII